MIQIAGVAGLVGYPVLLTAYDRYYSAFGLRPEDVGIDRTAILARTLGALPFFFFPLMFMALFLFSLRGVPSWIERLDRQVDGLEKEIGELESRTLRAQVRSNPGGELKQLQGVVDTTAKNKALIVKARRLNRGNYWLFRVTQVLYLLGVVLLTVSTTRLATTYIELRESTAILGVRTEPIGGLGLTMLDLKAEPVKVEWLGSKSERPALLDPTLPIRFSYLGQQGGTLVLYALPGGALRVPADDVFLTFICVKFVGSSADPRCSADPEVYRRDVLTPSGQPSPSASQHPRATPTP